MSFDPLETKLHRLSKYKLFAHLKPQISAQTFINFADRTASTMLIET